MSSATLPAADGGLRDRKRRIDDVWLLTLAVVLVSVGIPWSQRILDIDLTPIAWSTFAFGCLYVAVSQTAERIARPWIVQILSIGLNTVGVVMLGFLWRLSGGLQNPIFVLVFVPPVIAGSLLLSRWHAYGTAAVAVATVTVVALVDNPALRWYLLQLGVPGESALTWLASLAATTVRPFPGAVAPPAALAVAILLFGALMFAVATASGVVGQAMTSLQQRLAAVTAALTQAEGLSLEAIRWSPWPTVLLHVDTFRVAHASRTFLDQFFVDAEALESQDFFSLVQFSYPDAVEALITQQDGVLPVAVCHVQGETRLTRVHVRRLEHANQRYASVSLWDVSDLRYFRMTLDAVEQPLILIEPRGLIRDFNPAAKQALPALAPGIDAGLALQASDIPFEWWNLGRRTRRRLEVRLAERRFSAHCAAIPIEGEDEKITVVTLQLEAGGS